LVTSSPGHPFPLLEQPYDVHAWVSVRPDGHLLPVRNAPVKQKFRSCFSKIRGFYRN